MRLDRRLAAVAMQIPFGAHADIGSDHAYLLRWLLRHNKIRCGIAIEKTESPFANSLRTLKGLKADVRLADGFAGLSQGEADSVSLCGMGGRLISNILEAFPDRVPATVIAAPNDHPDQVRRWAIRMGYGLVDESFVLDRHPYMIMRFERGMLGSLECDNQDDAIALQFGPLLIERWEPEFVAYLQREKKRLDGYAKRTAESQQRLDAIVRLLAEKSASV
ncbi:class I SAM-dependent methyltransferase [Stieleria sp. JC731]|uniref:tRNA (adenine(22)-N(1))-methyltransferase n=1 Tax=Pirellulaceae TaxID=2691357 RepID=UPI001E3F2868|nr:tRNA (adenine(22)-N(1))-methyltransferase TrmK [Stieleria sp. JC731]MCC9599343.1 class I SAM-dependent methyltransferase [Stieleria sp. JC731]